MIAANNPLTNLAPRPPQINESRTLGDGPCPKRPQEQVSAVSSNEHEMLLAKGARSRD